MKYLLILLLLVGSALAQTDGPATLPQITPETRASYTPSSNYPKYVGPSDSLVSALASALPGDTLVVDPANTTTSAVNLVLSNGDCPNNRWITIKSASALIPDEFTRITPAFAAQLPKIVLTGQSASITGGNCVRLIGFEVSRPSGTGIVYNLFRQLGTNVILDRLYVHGTATDETSRGVMLSDSHYVSVINSYFSDFHCRAISGVGCDGQAIGGGTDSVGGGVYLIRNNYIEAAGEGIILGGGASVDVPADITIQYDDIIKRASWNPADPTYDGGTAGADGIKHPWVAKNCMELKNAQRVLIEGVWMENSWGGFTQVGNCVTITPKNQAGAPGVGLCPICAVKDVTVRYSHIRSVAQAFQIGNAMGGGWSQGGGNYSIHDILADNLQYPTCYQCSSFTNTLGSQYDATNPPPNSLQNISLLNSTFLLAPTGWLAPPADSAASQANGFMVVASPPPGVLPMNGIHVDNNVFDSGSMGLMNSGGYTNNCWSGAFKPVDLKTKVLTCWPGGSFTGNQITTSKWSGYLPWPDGNFIGTVAPTAGANQSLINSALSLRH